MSEKSITSMRDVMETFKDEFIVIDKEVDPVYEIAGIQQALQDSYGLLFNNIKGYPGVRTIGNALSRDERAAKMFNVDDLRGLRFKCHQAMKNPVPPRIVKDAPCQEVVITNGIDLPAMLPVIKHTSRDAAHVSGGGILLVTGPGAHGGSDLTFRRMHFRGKDWATIWIGPVGHFGEVFTSELRGKRVDVTINICPPPAVLVTAGTYFVKSVVPTGSDELGFAGALQGCPVDIVKAKTVDAYAIANAEWVVEGYISTDNRAWETDEAEAVGIVEHREEAPPFFPEWHGYLGRAIRSYKLQVTALTHRQDPIFFAPHARSIEADIIAAPMREACFYELAERLAPGLVTDVNVMPGVASWGSFVILQVKKRRPRDEGKQKEILAACLVDTFMQLAIIIDEDIDIHSPHDVLWALATRCDPESIILGPPRLEVLQGAFPARRGIGIDTTVAFDKKPFFERAHFPSDVIDLEKWISKEKLATAQAIQGEYAKVLARTGH